MKKIIFRRSSLVLKILVLSLFLGSCQKSQVGPAGPAGAEGNANVKSLRFTVNTWRADSACNYYYYKYHTSELTSAVLNNGAILLYMGEDNGNEWRPLPLSETKFEYNFSLELSLLRIEIISENGGMPENPGSKQFKLIIIPPAE
jgi:hypothetical protein